MTNLVIGASLKHNRYSNMAIHRLRSHGHKVAAIGLLDGRISDVQIIKGTPAISDVDTVLLYINPGHQIEYYDYVVSLHPRRVLFAPGTENPEFYKILDKNGIKSEEACSLVLLSSGQY